MSHRKKLDKSFFIALFICLILLLGLFFLVKKHDNFSFLKPSKNHEFSTENSNFWLRIDKLKIKAPVAENVDGENKKKYNETLTHALAHYKGTSLPNGKSNVFIFGHSDSDLDKGPFRDIFAKLNDLNNGDKITVYYKGNYYHYTVREKKVVRANNVSVLKQGPEEILTLMTCWPVGTKDKRLVVIAGLDK
jgi:sortase A